MVDNKYKELLVSELKTVDSIYFYFILHLHLHLFF